MNYEDLYLEEKTRRIALEIERDFLQSELNLEEECHYDECVLLKAEIAFLKQRLRMKELN